MTFVTPERRTSRAIASTAYDTAWVAAVPHPQERRDPRFPSALDWVAAQQLPDGSWGSAIPFVHDRMLCTLAALIPLARFGRREQDRLQVQRGERYLWQHAHVLHTMPCELVGFELLLPTLAQLAADAGVQVPPYLDGFAAERERKLALLPDHLIYSPYVTVVHSLEFLGTRGDPQRLLGVRAANGSIGNSPAATAYLLHHLDDPQAVDYLSRCLATDQNAAVAVLDPCETFEALWIAYHRWLGGAPAASVLSAGLRDQLLVDLASNGVSLSPSFPIPDADDTAVALLLLHEAGIGVEPSALCRFERDGYFVSFPYERHASTGVNIHALQAIVRYPHYPNVAHTIGKIVQFLHDAQQQGSYWLDKWHISPLYATSRAVVALLELPDPFRQQGRALAQTAVQWILHTQNENGSWGFFGIPTVEETAYAVLALNRLRTHSSHVRQAIASGTAYLTAHQHDPQPAMWMDKCLYHPTHIVHAVIDAAIKCTQASNDT